MIEHGTINWHFMSKRYMISKRLAVAVCNALSTNFMQHFETHDGIEVTDRSIVLILLNHLKDLQRKTSRLKP